MSITFLGNWETLIVYVLFLHGKHVELMLNTLFPNVPDDGKNGGEKPPAWCLAAFYREIDR